MRRRLWLAWVTPSARLLFHLDWRTGVSFWCIEGEIDPGVTPGCGRQQELLGVYPTQVSCFNPRMANVTVVLMYNGYTLFQPHDVPSLHGEIIQ